MRRLIFLVAMLLVSGCSAVPSMDPAKFVFTAEDKDAMVAVHVPESLKYPEYDMISIFFERFDMEKNLFFGPPLVKNISSTNMEAGFVAYKSLNGRRYFVGKVKPGIYALRLLNLRREARFFPMRYAKTLFVCINNEIEVFEAQSGKLNIVELTDFTKRQEVTKTEVKQLFKVARVEADIEFATPKIVVSDPEAKCVGRGIFYQHPERLEVLEVFN